MLVVKKLFGFLRGKALNHHPSVQRVTLYVKQYALAPYRSSRCQTLRILTNLPPARQPFLIAESLLTNP